MTAIYKTGTATVTNGSTAVTGSDTAWLTALVTGGLFTMNGLSVPIESVGDEDELTLALPWPGSGGTGVYAIVRDNSTAALIVSLNDRLAQIIARMVAMGIPPSKVGTLTERDALTLGVEDDQFIFLRFEVLASVLYVEFYRWDGTDWLGPYDPKGEDGNDSTVPGPPGPGLSPAGEWDIGTEYSLGDYVQFNGRTFASLVDENAGNEPPDAEDDDAYWMWVPVVNGSDGTDGRTILSGTVDPTTEGEDGDFYIRTDTQHLFGPKAEDTWPAGVDLNGTNGIDGRTILSGAVDPTTEGADGDFYINTASQTIFGPKAEDTWPSGVSLKGTDGVSFVWKGAYSGATAYAENDVVRDSGSSWIALQATTGNAPPSLPTTSNAYWELFTAAGADGGGAGSVTSVAISVPTGLEVSGSPITTSGTFAIAFASGYSIPTNTNQGQWDAAYGWGNHASAGYVLISESPLVVTPIQFGGTPGTTATEAIQDALDYLATVSDSQYTVLDLGGYQWDIDDQIDVLTNFVEIRNGRIDVVQGSPDWTGKPAFKLGASGNTKSRIKFSRFDLWCNYLSSGIDEQYASGTVLEDVNIWRFKDVGLTYTGGGCYYRNVNILKFNYADVDKLGKVSENTGTGLQVSGVDGRIRDFVCYGGQYPIHTTSAAHHLRILSGHPYQAPSNYDSFTTTGTGPFVGTWAVDSTSHIQVRKDGVVLTGGGTDYSISLDGSGYPSVTLTSDLAGANLRLYLYLPTQTILLNEGYEIDFDDGYWDNGQIVLENTTGIRIGGVTLINPYFTSQTQFIKLVATTSSQKIGDLTLEVTDPGIDMFEFATDGGTWDENTTILESSSVARDPAFNSTPSYDYMNSSTNSAVKRVIRRGGGASRIQFIDDDSAGETVAIGSVGTKLSFMTNGSTRGHFLSNGEFIIGGDYSAFVTEHTNTSVTPSTQILSTGASASFMMGRFSNNSTPPRIFFAKSRGSSVGSHSACSSGDEAGAFSFAWSNGTAMAHGATIVARALDTPGTDYTQSEIAFQTSDGSGVPADRVRIRAGGTVHFPSVGTTGTGANAYLDNAASPANSLLRSTSSLAYKTNVEPIEDARADALLSIDPIWYHSLAPADKLADGRAKSFYSFGAEHLAEIDPRLVSWGYRDDDFDVVETADDEGGQVHVERVLKDGAELKPDGINDRAVMALLFNIVKRQDARIKALEEKLALS